MANLKEERKTRLHDYRNSSGSNGINTTNISSNTQNRSSNTYNPRYPGFDEANYKKLEKMVTDRGITGSEKTEVMDQLYEIYYPQVLNQQKLDERQQEINNSIEKNGELLLNGNKEVQMGTKLTNLSQMAKRKFNIPYNVPDDQVIDAMTKGIENGNKLLYEYVNNGDPELLYAAGIQERPQTKTSQMGGTRDLINKAATSDKARGDKNLWEKGETITNYTNLVGLGTEELDKKADEFANKWLNRGTQLTDGATENLKNKLESLSPEEVEAYRREYEQFLKDKDWRVGRVQGNTLVEQLRNAAKGNISYDYNDDDFMEWLINQKTNLREDLTGADDILKGESDPSIVQFFGNIPASALKTFTATVRGMTNPYDTMKGLYKLAATKEGHQAFLQRYGSWEGLAKAMNEDPVGVADDALAVANALNSVTKLGGKAFGSKNIAQNGLIGNYMPDKLGGPTNSIGSANDALAQKTVGGIYAGMDKLANLSDSSTVNKIAGGINRGLQDASNVSKAYEDAGKLKDAAVELKDKVIEGVAERLSGAKSSQDKLFQAQEPTLNRLSKERNTKNIRNKADVANELVVEDIRKNGGELPTDTQTRVDAHERAMKNKWNEIKEALGEKGDTMVSTKELADSLDAYIDEVEKLKISKNKADLTALKEQSADLRDLGEVDLLTLEKQKEMINANLNDWDDKSIGNVYKNGMTELTKNIGKIEDQIISEIPGEFQNLKNEFGSLKDGYGDIVKANVKAQRAKFGDNISNYSRIKGIGDAIKGIWHGDLGEIGKGVAQSIGGEITQKVRDKNWLIEQGFKDLAAEMDAPGYKSVRAKK